MRCDYLRMCFVLAEGGLYVDADDVLLGEGWRSIFRDGKLKVQPLCYDIAAGAMMPSAYIWQSDIPADDRIFYVNNDPIAAPAGHPVLRRALRNATAKLLDDAIRARVAPDDLPVGRWEEIVRAAHAAGFSSTAVLFYGHVETAADRVAHLLRLADVQLVTGGFTELVPIPLPGWGVPLVPGRSPIDKHRAMVAVARLLLRPEVGIEHGRELPLAEGEAIALRLLRGFRQRTTTYGVVRPAPSGDAGGGTPDHGRARPRAGAGAVGT